MGGGAPAALNAANEIAVDAFLKGKLDFTGIPKTLATVLKRYKRRPKAKLSLAAILETDTWARREAGNIIYV